MLLDARSLKLWRKGKFDQYLDSALIVGQRYRENHPKIGSVDSLGSVLEI